MLKRQILFISILILGYSNNILAQNDKGFKIFKDTLLAAFKKKPSLTGYLDGRRSFTNSAKANVFGIFGGVNYGNRVDIGLGYYFIDRWANYPTILNRGTPYEIKANRTVKFNYWAIKTEYTFYKTKHLEFAIPFVIGVGKGIIQNFYRDTLKLINEINLPLIPIESGISGVYLFRDWIGVSAGLSYRLNLTHWAYFNEFSSINYTFGISIRFGRIWRHIKNGPKDWINGCKSCINF